MKLTGWEMSCWPSDLHRLALPGQQQGQEMQIPQDKARMAFSVVTFLPLAR